MSLEADKQGASQPPEDEHTTGAGAPNPPPSSSPSDGEGYYEDPYSYESGNSADSTAVTTTESAPPPPVTPPPPPAAKAPEPPDPEDEEEDGMLRMSFLEHLEELRGRLIKCLAGVGVAFVVSLTFANSLWNIVRQPAVIALTQLGYKDPRLAQITPMETFNTVWVKLPILTSIFLVSPWILYQVWAFISPGLYRRERRWAAPFIISSSLLFIGGGLFAYFVAFRFGLTFLLGIGRDIGIMPLVSVTEYFDLFVNVTLGVGLVFELPVLIFFLTLLRIVTPGFLLRNARYAILIITIIAAIVTPTPDVFNLMLFAVPMWLLFFAGVFASYLLVLHRDDRKFPWAKVLYVAGVVLTVIAGLVFLAITKYGYKMVPSWPFFTR